MWLISLLIQAAEGETCTSTNQNTIQIPYTIEVCDNDLLEHVQAAIKYWRTKGAKLKLNPGISSCTRQPSIYTIQAQYNDFEVNKEHTDTFVAYAVTEQTHFYNSLDIRHSVIFIATNLPEDRLSMLMIHEMGHALGYEHVDKSCEGYVMHPYNSKMGLKL